MGDLDFKLSSSGEKDFNQSKLSNESLDLKIHNGTFEKVSEPEAKIEPYEEEYFQSLFDEKNEKIEEIEEKAEDESIETTHEGVSGLAEEIFGEITAEISQDEEEISKDETAHEGVSGLADEIFEEITAEISQDEEEISKDETTHEGVSGLAEEIFEEITAEISQDEEEISQDEEVLKREENDEPLTDLSSEKEILLSANRILQPENNADKVLNGLSQSTQKDKYDFLNLCILSVVILLLGLTFIFMKQSTSDDGVKFEFETLKTGEFTEYISENFTEKMPLEKIMTQANVFLRKLFGKTDLEYVVFKDNEPPNGPVDNSDLGGASASDVLSPEDVTTTTTASVTAQTTTTPKIAQGFEISAPDETDSDDKVFTGRPIKTTTTKVTTTLKLPKTTDETTTGKVNLILP